jgi:integrase
MVLLAARLGMRSSDITNLMLSNIDWHKDEISFTTQKTGKFTTLPLTTEIGNAIICYLKQERPECKGCNFIFLRLQKPYRSLQPSALYRIVSKAMRDAGVFVPSGKRKGPHSLRASLASNMLNNNTPLPVISEVLSHSSTDTTKVYLKVDFEQLRRLSLDVPSLSGVWMGGVMI